MSEHDWYRYDGIPPKSIIQGEFGVSSDEADYFSTLLGSCVSVCIFDPYNKVGGMNHMLLPKQGKKCKQAGKNGE